MKTAFKLFALSATFFFLWAADISAQSKSSTSKTAASKKAASKKVKAAGKSKSKSSKSGGGTRRLPRYFTHLKLNAEQREEVFQVQATYKEEINALMNQLAELKEEQQDRLEDVLSRTQKSVLNKYKAGTLKVGKQTDPKSRGGSKGATKKRPKTRKAGTRKSASQR